ncbi:MAG: amidohydrolase family protein [Planctomycetota bacterium]
MVILRTKYLILNPDTVIEDGAVVIKDGKIRQAGPAARILKKNTGYLNLNRTVLMPGLINPHTHLEGPELYGGIRPAGARKLKPPQYFPAWAAKVIKIRLRLKPRDFIKTTKHGYEICLKNGITTVGDHTHIERTLKAHQSAPLRRILLEEVINLNSLTAEETAQLVKKNLRQVSSNNSLLRIGLAPHAPYSVSGHLYQALFKIARQMKIPLSTHLSELKEEVELLKKGKGPLLSFLKKIGRFSPFWYYPRLSPVEYLNKLGMLKPPTFLIHCNYLSQNDIKLLAQNGVSVVFCPKSQHYFGHKNHPFRQLLKNKVNVALGTDGLGSNDNLSILEEMRFIAQNYSGIRPAQLLKMGTVNAARALGLSKQIGLIKPGYEADLAAFPLNQNITSPKQVIPYLIKTCPPSIMTMVSGKIVYDRHNNNSLQ